MKTKRDQTNNHNGQMMDTKPKPEASSQIMIATSKNQESLQTDNRNFPFKLYDMLEFASVSGYCSVFSWTPDGHSFAILKDDEFLNNIVPMFFKQTKLRSFTRQLNLWGFHRIVHKCSNKGAWYSKYFVRGQPNDLKNIMRLDTTRKFKYPRRPSPPPLSIIDIPTMAAAAAQSAEIQNHFCTPPSHVLSRAEGKQMPKDYTDNFFVLARDILHFLLDTIFEREENTHDNDLSSENFVDFEW